MDTADNIKEQAKEIKRSFRLMMDGVTSMSMREKGVNYNVNWGASLSMLKSKAKEIGENFELANELWKDNVRECKILAILIMPKDKMTEELADLWISQTTTQEIAELSAFYLYQHLDFIPAKALEWISSDGELYKLCGYNILSRLFNKQLTFQDEHIDKYISSLRADMQSNTFIVRKAAMVSATHFSDIGNDCELKIKRLFEELNLEVF